MYDALGFEGALEVASLLLLVTLALWLIFGHLFDRKEYQHFKGRKKPRHSKSDSMSELKE